MLALGSRLRAWPALALLAALTLVSLGGCREPATRADCERVFERILALELSELGYRDKALLARRRRELRRRFGDVIRRCVGRRKKRDLARCVARARSAEQLVHDCL